MPVKAREETHGAAVPDVIGASDKSPHVYQFGPFRLDSERELLFREDEAVLVAPKAIQILLALIRRNKQLVTKEELMKAVWPDTFVEEANLSRNIFLLRKALGESPQEHRYIVTVARRGYRFSHDVRLVRGEHGDEELVEPERVRQLIAPDLTDTFSPFASPASVPNNLPRQVTPLIGREEVLAEVESLVREHSLVTLVGTGGIGKTRLALQAGTDRLDGSADGVWLVELASLGDAALIVNTIAATFGLREQADRSLLDVLVQYLRPRHLLLILDNCEHLIAEVAKIADSILRAAPQVRMLTTSREPLRIAGEHVYRVPSLAVPSGGSLTSAEALHYGAVALFAERARA
jgi:DNA-binding winged helix-turn-helix (wHTH) protein